MIVWVASYPRSGNTLTLLTLLQIYRQSRIGSISRSDLTLGGAPSRWVPQSRPPRPAGLPAELQGLGQPELLSALKGHPEPYFIKTHKLAQASTPDPALYVVRDGRDSIVSQAHFVGHRSVPQFQGMSFEQRMARLIWPGVPSSGYWSQSVEMWWGRDAPTAILRFEALLDDPVSAVKNSCAKLGVELPAPDGKLVPFAELHRQNPIMFRHGRTGEWRQAMPEALQARFWRVHEKGMRVLGYRRKAPRPVWKSWFGVRR